MGFRLDKALDVIQAEQEAIILKALENIRAYNNAIGIGEHPDLVEAVESQIKIIAEARDIISATEFVKLQDVTAV